jgi:hypothetical protein
VGGRRARGPPDRHRGWGRHRWPVAAADHTFRRFEARESDDLFSVGRAVEAHDRRLAEDRLHAAEGAHGVVTDDGPGARPRVGRQANALADRERRRLLLLGAWRAARLRTRGRLDHGDGGGHFGLLLLLLLVIVVVKDDDDLGVLDGVDLDDVLDGVDLDDVLDDVWLGNLIESGRLLGFVVGAAGGGVGWWCASGHV